MRNTILLLVILAGLAGVYFVFVTGGNTSLDESETEFAVKDTAAIGKITLEKVVKGKKKETLTLERRTGYWTVNGNYTVFGPRMNNFLETVAAINVKDKLKGKAQEGALKALKDDHIIVTILDGKGGQLKKYFVGITNSKQNSNIVLLEGADNAYMVSRPGLEGFISIQYSTNPVHWREKLLFAEKKGDLATIRMSYSDSTKSFTLTRPAPDAAWQLADFRSLSPKDFRSSRADEYTDLFKGNIYAAEFAEFEVEDHTVRDSLLRLKPLAQMNLETFNGSRTEMKLYGKPDRSANYYGIVDKQEEVFIVQTFVIDKFLVPVDFFRR